MRTETYEIVMPKKCRVMTEEEMEYEGGFLNFIAAAVYSVASIGCSALAAATGNKELEHLSIGLDVASAALSCGVTACVSLAGKTAAKAVTSKVIKSTINAGDKVGTLNGLISADDYVVASKILDYTSSKPLAGVTAAYKHYS